MNRYIPTVVALVAVGGLLTGCVPNASTGSSTTIAVESTADDCIVETGSAASGTVTFTVTNSGERVTEFYLLGEDGVSIVSEVENITPGSSRDLTVVVEPGSYFTECKPGMNGAGVGRAPFTVTDDANSAPS